MNYVANKSFYPRVARSALICLATASMSLQANAQGSDVCLEIFSAMEIAAESDPTVIRSLARETGAESVVDEIKSVRRPQLSTFGRSGFGDESVVDSGVSNQAGIQISQRIFDFGDYKLGRAAADAGLEAARFRTADERVEAARRAATAYLSVLAADEKLALTQERKVGFQNQLTALRRLIEVGGATLTEETTVSAEVADADVLAFQLELERREALIELNLSTSSDQPPCAGSAARIGRLMAGSAIVTAQDVLSSNPEIEALRFEVDQSVADGKRQRRAHLPIFNVVATGSYASAGEFDNFEYRDRIGIDVSVPLYTGGAVKAAASRAAAREEESRSELMLAERRLRREVATRNARADVLERQLKARREALNQKDRLLDAARRERDAGTMTTRELVEIRLDYETSALQEIDTRYALALEHLETLFMDGRIRP